MRLFPPTTSMSCDVSMKIDSFELEDCSMGANHKLGRYEYLMDCLESLPKESKHQVCCWQNFVHNLKVQTLPEEFLWRNNIYCRDRLSADTCLDCGHNSPKCELISLIWNIIKNLGRNFLIIPIQKRSSKEWNPIESNCIESVAKILQKSEQQIFYIFYSHSHSITIDTMKFKKLMCPFAEIEMG